MGFGDVTTFKVPERMWFLFLPRIKRIERIGRIVSYGDRIDQKVCCSPWAYALAARCVCSAM